MDKRELRAPKKKNFKLEYETIRNVLDELSDIELGEYFKAVCNYELYGDTPEAFSDRTVRAMFRVTCRELDYQLAKHEGNRERGRQNRGSREEHEPIDEEVEVCTDLMEMLSVDDIYKLEQKLPNVSLLLDEIQEQIDFNNTDIHNPVSYILTYARNTDWAERCDQY